jgi:hypothetical protein
MSTKHTHNWLIDAALFIGLIAAFFLDFTGIELHQWIGVAGGALATYHLLAHWSWVKAVTGRFFGKTARRSRLYYLLDSTLLIGFLSLTFTGLVISSWLDLSLTNADSWLTIHIFASIGTLILATLKIVLHWRWIAAVNRKLFTAPPVPMSRPVAAAPAPAVSGRISRAEFLKIAGIACAASFLALTQAVNSLGAAERSSGSTELAAQVGSASSNSSTSSLSSASQACTLRCDKSCAYPGHCRRYQDTNGNGRCDLGECA